ncbi:MAG: hypothetical protein AMXMBFR34_35460 [Myxococcaceae bacterium]
MCGHGGGACVACASTQACTQGYCTANLLLENGTSFALVSAVVDGYERIANCTSIAPGGTLSIPVEPGTHTWTAYNGTYAPSGCARSAADSWGYPTPFTVVVGTSDQRLQLTQAPVTSYLLTPQETYACWSYYWSDSYGNTRQSKLRINRDGSWLFREYYTVNGALVRSLNGAALTETGRSLTNGYEINFQLQAAWPARYAVLSSSLYLNAGGQTGTLLYLHQTISNCP